MRMDPFPLLSPHDPSPPPPQDREPQGEERGPFPPPPSPGRSPGRDRTVSRRGSADGGGTRWAFLVGPRPSRGTRRGALDPFDASRPRTERIDTSRSERPSVRGRGIEISSRGHRSGSWRGEDAVRRTRVPLRSARLSSLSTGARQRGETLDSSKRNAEEESLRPRRLLSRQLLCAEEGRIPVTIKCDMAGKIVRKEGLRDQMCVSLRRMEGVSGTRTRGEEGCCCSFPDSLETSRRDERRTRFDLRSSGPRC